MLARLICIVMVGMLGVRLVQAQSGARTPCQAPAADITVSVTKYVMKKFHVASSSQILLEDSAKANEDCYWRYRYQMTATHRETILYLAPDRRYLTTTLFDRNSDPLAEEKAQRDEMVKALTAIKSPSRGPQAAAVTLIEFSDFQCPYCQKLTNILEQEVLPGEPDVRIIFKNYPLPMHPWARPAAQVIACAGMQNDDAFWKMHDYTFTHQKEFTAENVEERLTAFAGQQTGIDAKAFHDCVDRGLSVGPVMKDEELGRKEGVHATPTVFINGTRVEGIRDAAQLKQLIASARSGDLVSASSQTASAVASSGQGSACAPPIRKGGNDGSQ